MKILLPILALATLPAAAHAASIGGEGAGQLQVVGSAPSACVIAAPGADAGANAAFQAEGAGGRIRITDLVDPQTAEPRATSIALAFPVTCNSAHRLTVRAEGGGLVRSGPPAPAAPGFADRVAYRVSAAWAGRSASGGSESLTPVDLEIPDGAAGVLSLNVSIAAGGAPLIAGAYAGSLVVELQAAN